MTIRKLGRKKEHRERTLRNLATSVLLYEKVVTTEAKAKAVSPVVERLITQALRGTIAARREAKRVLFDPNAVTKLFEDLKERAANRTSGFVRLTKLPARPSDGSSMVQIELLFMPLEEVIAKQNKTAVKVRKTTKTTDIKPTTEESQDTL